MNEERRPTTHDAEHPEDLSVLGRRGLLDEPEQRRLEMCLAAAESLRVLHQLGRDFDSAPRDEIEDEALTKQLVLAAEARYVCAPSPRRLNKTIRRLAALSAAAISLMAVGAFAATWRWPAILPFAKRAAVQTRVNSEGDRRVNPARGMSGVRQNAACPPVCSAQFAAADPDSVSSQKQAAPQPTFSQSRSETDRDRPAIAASPEAASATMASRELFSAANAARRLGDWSRAAELYTRLQSDFSNSSEAALSFVLLARLELARGIPRQALLQFDEYLQRVPGGSLTQEALQGKAQSLRQLGQVGDEAAAWRELLRRFPDSIYAKTARERLGESGN